MGFPSPSSVGGSSVVTKSLTIRLASCVNLVGPMPAIDELSLANPQELIFTLTSSGTLGSL